MRGRCVAAPTFAETGVFTGDGCASDEDACECKFAANEVSAAFIDAETQCAIFESDFECAAGEACVIDCADARIFSDGCGDKLILGESATSLTVLCNGDEESASCRGGAHLVPVGQL